MAGWKLALPPKPPEASPSGDASQPLLGDGQPASPWQVALSPNRLRDEEERKAHGGYTVAEITRIMDQPALWGRLHGRCEHRLSKEAVPWVPTLLQKRMIQHYTWCRDRGLPCRMVVLKIRRGGGSTGMSGLLYIHLHTHRTRAGVIGTDYEVSSNMMKMLKFFNTHDNFPGWCKASKVIDDAIEWPNGSSVQRYTAENPEASRSAGLQAAHASEVARWQDSAAISSKETLRSIRGSIPRSGFTLEGEESTAQGSTGSFAETFARGRWPEYAVWPAPWKEETPDGQMEFGEDLQHVRIFAAWFEDVEARTPVTPEQIVRIQATLNKIERDLIARYARTGPRGDRLGSEVDATMWEQLAWRRMVVASEFDGDEEAFDQENPSSPAVAFASSGRHTFHRGGVSIMATAAPQHRQHGILSTQSEGHVVFTATQPMDGWLELYEEPREGFRYIIGVDTMTGVEQVKNSGVSDWNGCMVLRAAYVDEHGVKQPMMVVAALRAKNDDNPDILFAHVNALSKFYGRCMVVPEVNGPGYAFLVLAKQAGMNLWRRQDYDKVTQETTEHAGWKTDEKTRDSLISALQSAIRANALEGRRGDGLLCPNKTACAEASAMALGADGKHRAPHDDHVFALGLCVVNVTSATYFAARRRKRHEPPDRKQWKLRE